MKKFLIGIAALTFIAQAMFAVDFTVGGRGNFNVALGTYFVDKDVRDFYKENNPNVGGGFGAYVNIGLTEMIGIQPELNLAFNNGLYMKEEMTVGKIKSSVKLTNYNISLDIPVLVTFDWQLSEMFKLGFGVGPVMSIGFPWKMKGESEVTGVNDKMTYSVPMGKTTFAFGPVADIFFGIKAGSGNIIINARYQILPLSTKTKVKIPNINLEGEWKGIARGSLQFSVGYEYTF